MKKIILSSLLLLSALGAEAQTPPSSTNTVFANIMFDVAGVTTPQAIIGDYLTPANPTQPTVNLCLSNAASVVSAGTLTGSQLLICSASDTLVSLVISNGSLHAWTNIYGQILLTNTFAVPRLNTNYTVNVIPWMYPGSAINPYTYVPIGTFVVSNMTTTNCLIVSTGGGTAVPLSDQIGLQLQFGQ